MRRDWLAGDIATTKAKCVHYLQCPDCPAQFQRSGNKIRCDACSEIIRCARMAAKARLRRRALKATQRPSE